MEQFIDFISSPAVAGVISLVVVGIVFQLIRAVLRWAKARAAETPTKLDDEIIESLSDAVDAAEPSTKKVVSDLLKSRGKL